VITTPLIGLVDTCTLPSSFPAGVAAAGIARSSKRRGWRPASLGKRSRASGSDGGEATRAGDLGTGGVYRAAGGSEAGLWPTDPLSLPWKSDYAQENLRIGRVSAVRRGVPKAEIHARTTHGVTRCASSFLKHSLQPSLCSSRRIGVSKPVC
jgi:hypothetical protein